MPITTRRRYYFLLGRYVERDNAASKGKSNLPPIEVEDQVSAFSKSLSDQSKDTSSPSLPYDSLPEAVKEALLKMDKDQSSESKEKSKVNMSQKRLTITQPTSVSQNINKSVESKTKKSTKKPISVTDKSVPSNEPKDLKEASERLKQKKVSIPKELLDVIKQKAQNR